MGFKLLSLIFLLFSSASLAQEVGSQVDFNSGFTILCSANNCPTYVGALDFADTPALALPDGTMSLPLFGHCSTTLISPTQILTAAHCVPPEIRQEGAKCGHWIQLHFPEVGKYPRSEHVCGVVERLLVGHQDDPEKRFEWAILTLKTKTDRPHLASIEKSPIEFGTTLQSYPVYYNPMFPMGEIHKTTCQVSESGWMHPQTFNPVSAQFFAVCDKTVIVGNSGTGFFDNEGKYVGILSATTTEKFKTDGQTQRDGSLLVIGNKNLCMDLDGRGLGDRASACGLKSNTPSEFHRATVITSTLNAFERTLSEHKIDTQKISQLAQAIVWEKATVENSVQFFVDLYHDATYLQALEFFTAGGTPELAREYGQKGANVLGQVPRCIDVQKISAGGSEKMLYTVLSFADFENDPYGPNLDLLYFRYLDDMRLDVDAEQIPIDLTISQIPGTSEYLVSYEKKTSPFGLTAGEINYKNTVCQNEQQVRKDNCNGDPYCAISKAAQMPSDACQTIYKKLGFSNYLKKFSFKVPSCD